MAAAQAGSYHQYAAHIISVDTFYWVREELFSQNEMKRTIFIGIRDMARDDGDNGGGEYTQFWAFELWPKTGIDRALDFDANEKFLNCRCRAVPVLLLILSPFVPFGRSSCRGSRCIFIRMYAAGPRRVNIEKYEYFIRRLHIAMCERLRISSRSSGGGDGGSNGNDKVTNVVMSNTATVCATAAVWGTLGS